MSKVTISINIIKKQRPLEDIYYEWGDERIHYQHNGSRIIRCVEGFDPYNIVGTKLREVKLKILLDDLQSKTGALS